ncbi:MAG TPA: histidine kinase dimerization/phospho-acceptor domain-containing protein, partial [Thermodesulfobacteriota bacterium]|nr:histidine kinase dimerization/phospho-acceptor domain-containing protein [Thermodesulfobacteriota bacterium]
MNRQGIHSIRSKLLALMVLRVVLALAFLSTAFWFQLRESSLTKPSFYPIHAVVVTVCFLTIFYALLLKHVKNLKLFAYLQVIVDIALITGTVYVTGGIVSYLPVLYFISVIGSSILLDKRAGYYAASVSSGAYAALVYLDFKHLLPLRYKVFFSPYLPEWEDVITTISTNVLGMFVVAYLAGYLAEKTAIMEKELEEKGIDLDRLENLNRLIVDNIPTGIMTLDGESRITSFNRAASAITGYSVKDVYYRGVDAVSPEFLKGTKVPPYEAARTEINIRKKNGPKVCIGFTVSSGQGGEMASIIIFQDLTVLKAMEEQIRRDDRLRALGDLSASLAHEIRNPLASLSGSVQVLNKGSGVKGEKRHLMEIVLRECERLNSLITDFLLFARPATKEKPERIDIAELIRETIKVFTNSPQAKGIDIEDRLTGSLFVEGDRRQMSQVFWNLFLNAADAMKNGGKLTVGSAPKGPAGLFSKPDTEKMGPRQDDRFV